MILIRESKHIIQYNFSYDNQSNINCFLTTFDMENKLQPTTELLLQIRNISV